MGTCFPADPVPGIWAAEEPQQGGAGISGGGVQQVQDSARPPRPIITPLLTSHLACLIPTEPNVSREACHPPRLKASAPIWSQRCASTTGSPIGEKRKPSGRSWPWTPSTRSPTASTLCCLTAHHTTPRTALHRPVRHSADCITTSRKALNAPTDGIQVLNPVILQKLQKAAWFTLLQCVRNN